MNRFKHRNARPGLSLVESIIALGMLGVLISSVMVVQQSSFTKINTSSAKLRRIFLMNNMLLEATRNRKEGTQFPEKIAVSDPETTIFYTRKEAEKNSSLKDFNNITIENIEASWQDGSVKYREKIIHVVYEPEVEQKGKSGP